MDLALNSLAIIVGASEDVSRPAALEEWGTQRSLGLSGQLSHEETARGPGYQLYLPRQRGPVLVLCSAVHSEMNGRHIRPNKETWHAGRHGRWTLENASWAVREDSTSCPL